MDKKPLIQIKDLVKKFGSFTALNGVSLDYIISMFFKYSTNYCNEN